MTSVDSPQADESLVTDSTPEFIYEVLRGRILSGSIAAGSDLVQARVADEFGTSRGPVRLYALRVVNEALALRVSIPRFTPDELDRLSSLATAIASQKPDNFDEWEDLHEQFHNLLIGHCGPSLQTSLTQWSDFTERYRRAYVADRSGGWILGSREHLLLAEQCANRNADAAVNILAEHLGRAGLTLMAMIDPRHEPVLVRAAMEQVIT